MRRFLDPDERLVPLLAELSDGCSRARLFPRSLVCSMRPPCPPSHLHPCSASELAGKELAGIDVSLRGAVSIARRLQVRVLQWGYATVLTHTHNQPNQLFP
jgi:hypothetical protein